MDTGSILINSSHHPIVSSLPDSITSPATCLTTEDHRRKTRYTSGWCRASLDKRIPTGNGVRTPTTELATEYKIIYHTLTTASHLG